MKSTLSPLSAVQQDNYLQQHDVQNHTLTDDNSSQHESALLLKALYEQYNLDPSLNWKLPQYYSLAYQIIGTIFQGIIFIVGMREILFYSILSD